MVGCKVVDRALICSLPTSVVGCRNRGTVAPFNQGQLRLFAKKKVHLMAYARSVPF